MRAEATSFSRQVGSIKEGEVYAVSGRSSDGEWFRLIIPALAAGEGWVSTNFVTVIGDITDIPVILAPTPLPPTPTPVRLLPTPTVKPATATAAAGDSPLATPAETPTPSPTTAAQATGPDATVETPPVLLTATSTVTPTPAGPPPAGFARVVTDGARLRVRAAPDAGAAIVGYAYAGELYAVLESSADGAWARIGGSPAGAGENPDGGWVATRFLLVGP